MFHKKQPVYCSACFILYAAETLDFMIVVAKDFPDFYIGILTLSDCPTFFYSL